MIVSKTFTIEEIQELLVQKLRELANERGLNLSTKSDDFSFHQLNESDDTLRAIEVSICLT